MLYWAPKDSNVLNFPLSNRSHTLFIPAFSYVLKFGPAPSTNKSRLSFKVVRTFSGLRSLKHFLKLLHVLTVLVISGLSFAKIGNSQTLLSNRFTGENGLHIIVYHVYQFTISKLFGHVLTIHNFQISLVNPTHLVPYWVVGSWFKFGAFCLSLLRLQIT